jgi:hypothetical protein
MNRIVLLSFLLFPLITFGGNDLLPRRKLMVLDDNIPEYHPQGTIQMGMRSTVSLFNRDGGPGYGVGGQFRIWLAKKVNTEWFADYITTDLDGLGKRVDGHIGWSVMFYPFEGLLRSRFNPYLIAGHCFDLTKVTPYNSYTDLHTDESLKRRSSATQAGLGIHWNITSRFNLSLSTQYMIHLGKNIHAEIIENNSSKQLLVVETDGFSMEGHLLTSLSLNIRLGDLW